jgi:hypothetical protein
VGPRPFERHERDLFHGRKVDARLLRDRILSGRLTVFYAQSGLGKSSLLRTQVIPLIEEHGARAVYFDDWSQSDALGALKQALVAIASELGIPDPAAGRPTLTELVRLVSGSASLSVVLVLDQFENFLVRNADRLDPLRSELSALVRSASADASVLLTLREEYLAALEPFRQSISNLFESAYRLEELPEADLRAALLEPPKLFGGRCDEALADKLIADLKIGSASVASDVRASFVGLPMLQLVCQELWKQAHADGKVLTLAAYEGLGGAQRIIDNYVRGLMPRRSRDRSLTAALLKQLAPRSGLKNPCSVEDLTDVHRKADAVEAELKRLSGKGILRTRDYNTGVIYELQHDAFIRVLREWSDGVLARDRRRQMTFRFFAGAALVAALVYAGAAMQARQERELAEGKLRALTEHEAEERRLAVEQANRRDLQDLLEGGLLSPLHKGDPLLPSRFDTVTSFLLWDTRKMSDPQSLSKLQAVLTQYEKLLPDSYGMHFAPDQDVTFSGAKSSPLTIEYPKSRYLDQGQFLWVWRDYGKYIAGVSGYPVPTNVRFEVADGLDAQEVGVTAPGLPRAKVRAPTYDRQLLVRFSADQVKDARAKDFIQHYVPMTRFQPGFDWVLIPRWSLPVWKQAKEKDKIGYDEVAIDASGLAAYHILTHLSSPGDGNQALHKAFVTETAVNALLRNASHRYPAAVEEARLERGNCLANDLRAFVQEDPNALLDFPLLLDRLADQPCEEAKSPQTAPGGGPRTAVAVARQATRATQADFRASGAALFKPREKNLSAVDDDKSFVGMEDHLPSSDLRFQVNGASLADSDAAAIRAGLYRKYGVAIPSSAFSDSRAERTPRTVVRVDLRPGPDATPVIAARAEVNRELWITPDVTRALEEALPPNTRDWVRKQYSLTSVKRLLRMVVSDKTAQAQGGIRYPDWLLASLCFWSAAEGDDAWDGERMAKNLLETQRARLHPPATKISPVRNMVVDGMNSLAADRVDAATRSFSAAVKQDPAQARLAFLGLWPERLPGLWINAFRRRFDDLGKVELEDRERIDLEDLLAAGPPDDSLRRELAVFRLAAGVTVANRPTELQDLLDHAGPLDQFPVPQARWVAVEFLKQWDPLDSRTGRQRHFDIAVALLKHAVERAERQQDAYDAFRDMVALSGSVPGKENQGRNIPNWSWPVLDDLANRRPGGAPFNIPFDLSFLLSGEEAPDRLHRALTLADSYLNTLSRSELDAAERAHQEDLIAYLRSAVYERLSAEGDEKRLGEGEALCRKLLASKWIRDERTDLAQLIYTRLISVLHYQGRASEAHAFWEDARMKKWPDDFSSTMSSLDSAEMFGQIAFGNVAEAARIARLAEQGASPQNADATNWLFNAALGSIVTQRNDWRSLGRRLLAKDQTHVYKDYVLMIDYAFDGGDKSAFAAGLLAERRREIALNQATWSARLKLGDTTAWREMLLSHFAGAPETASLLDIVDNEERWKQSGLADLPITRRGLQCEAWFYEAMRAKAGGSTTRMLDCLRRSVAVGYQGYLEDSMARFILAHSPSPAAQRPARRR